MFSQNNMLSTLFSSQKGEELYDRIVETINKENMSAAIDKGVLVGFSGGADSVFLLSFLLEYRRRTNRSFKILAVHVNHCIRGEEADCDEKFSSDFCSDNGVEFISTHINVPSMSKKLGIGMEEAARNARYSFFDEIIRSRDDISTITVAHNSTDNAETVIMNILRGCGLTGVSGIKPTRDNIIRPIISISKREIVDLLDICGIKYVTDSSNLSSDYTRNYIRNEIMPMFLRINNDPDEAFARLTESLRLDLEFIMSVASEFIDKECSESIVASKIRELSPSIQSRVISKLTYTNTGVLLEEKHISALRELLKTDNFIYALPGEMNFVCQRGVCFFLPKKSENKLQTQIFSLSKGENKISGTNLTVYIGEFDKSSLNVYNFSIQAKLSSDIIDDGLILRFKKDGDLYRYSGVTHKLKKVFNDRNILPIERNLIPILCDSRGIVFVPGLSERDEAKSDISSKNISVTFVYTAPKENETELYTALLRK